MKGLVWDTDAVIAIIGGRDKKSMNRFLEHFVAGSPLVMLAGPTVMELAMWEPNKKHAKAFWELIRKNRGQVLTPKRKAYYQAGKWCKGVVFDGAEDEQKTKRTNLLLDALIASTAWANGTAAVTANVKDFAKVISAGKLEAGLSPEVLTVKEAITLLQ